MSTDTTWQVTSGSFAETEQLGRNIGERLRGGEVIELKSDLGGGKTTFVRGLAAGLGSNESVSSPSFTISQVYTASDKQLHHYDFYRLHEAGIMADEIAEVIADNANVTVVEWGEIVSDILPAERVSITITATGDNTRSVDMTIPESLQYLRSEQ